MSQESTDAVAYGRYVRYLINLYKDEGMEALIRFLQYEDEFTANQALAYMVQSYAIIEK